MSDLTDAFAQLVRKEIDAENFYSQIGKATNVDETKRTCDFTPIEADSKVTGVRLQGALSSTKGIVLVPKDNSAIVVSFFDRLTGFVVLTDELEKIIIDTDLVVFNGGSDDGMVKINDLVTQLNNLENAFNAHTHITTATVSGGSPGVLAVTVAPVTPTIKSDMENAKIKQ